MNIPLSGAGHRVAFLVNFYPVFSEIFILNSAVGLAKAGCLVDIIPVYGLAVQQGTRHAMQDALEAHPNIRIRPPLYPHQPRWRVLAAPGVIGGMVLGGSFRGIRAMLPGAMGREALSLRPLMLAAAFGWNGDYDIIHCQFATLAPLALSLRRAGLVRGRVVVHFRGYDITQHVKAEGEDVYREVFAQADWFVANCARFRDRAIALGADPARTSVAVSGTDISQFPFAIRKPPQGGPTRILGVGRLVEKKGFAHAIEAVHQLRGRGFDLRLDLIGEGPLRPDLEAAITARGLEAHVQLHGVMAHHEISARLREAHIFVAPCMRAANGDEDAPVNTIKEAMATGAPVIASRHGGIPEIVCDGVNGMLCDEDDADDLARKLEQLVAAPQLWEAFGRAGRTTVEAEYSLDVSTAQQMQAYASVLAAPSKIKENSMTDNPHSAPRVSIVISPRERFGEARASLANVLAETKGDYELIYVSGRTPQDLLRHIDAEAAAHGFRHIKKDRHLSPNEARNIGLSAARGEFVVFLDNDVFCAPEWLAPLVECAEETGADIVAPLTCHGAPLHTVVHQAGGEFAPDPHAFFGVPKGEREIVEVMHHQDDKVADLMLTRTETQLCEFHAVLVRRSVFERHGPLDEGMMATKEHLDLSMTVIAAGGKVMFEPRSVVTYFFPSRKSPIETSDWPFFLVRWSPEWQKRSYRRFQEKWGLKDTGYLEQREKLLSWRHEEGIIKPSLRKVPVLGRRYRFQAAGRALLSPLVRFASRTLVAREDRRRAKGTLPAEARPVTDQAV